MKRFLTVTAILIAAAFVNKSSSQDPPEDPDSSQGCYEPNGNNYCRDAWDGERCYITGYSSRCCTYSL